LISRIRLKIGEYEMTQLMNDIFRAFLCSVVALNDS
jgi:hypothetical protein